MPRPDPQTNKRYRGQRNSVCANEFTGEIPWR